jgi:hypothetical protein
VLGLAYVIGAQPYLDSPWCDRPMRSIIHTSRRDERGGMGQSGSLTKHQRPMSTDAAAHQTVMGTSSEGSRSRKQTDLLTKGESVLSEGRARLRHLGPS